MKYQCGWVVNQKDPDQLAKEIKNLVTNHELRSSIIEKAQRQARIDFSPDIAREHLLESIHFGIKNIDRLVHYQTKI